MRDLRSRDIIFEANLKTTLNLKEDVFMLSFFFVSLQIIKMTETRS